MRLIFPLIFFLPGMALCEDFFKSHERGWFWYERQPAPDTKKKQNEKSSRPAFSATQKMEVMQKRVTESLNRAILAPSEENLLNYANTYYQVINQGQNFADGYKMMLLKYPQYDYYLRFPINHQARLIQERQLHHSHQEAIRKLAATHGLLFFYSSHCQFCHAFAPTVKTFANRYGIHVMAISMDGGLLTEFPNAIRDNGIANKLGVRSWPSLFAVNPRTHHVIPLSNGMVSIVELEETLFKYVELAQFSSI